MIENENYEPKMMMNTRTQNNKKWNGMAWHDMVWHNGIHKFLL